jgi:hypothetical protein
MLDSTMDIIAKIDLDSAVAFASPLLYVIYVEIAKRVLPVENKQSKPLFDAAKLIHNMGLCIASLMLFVGVTYCAYESGKLGSLHAALCSPFAGPVVHETELVGRYFYLSKYWEWLDTAFLIIGGKEISWLQYTHHMSTAILVYVNISPFVSSASLLACFTNTFVHVFMYYYYAFPRGFMRRYRQWITTIQIVQHCMCLSGMTYIYLHKDECATTPIGTELALAMYVMYLTFFVMFYVVQYVQRGTSKGKDERVQVAVGDDKPKAPTETKKAL